jgi:hypothetical protein
VGNIAQILKRHRRGASRPRVKPSPSMMPCTPPRRTGATRCCTSCSPIVFPMARTTRGPYSIARVSASNAQLSWWPTACGGGRLLPVQSMGQSGRVFVDVGVLAPAEVMVLA